MNERTTEQRDADAAKQRRCYARPQLTVYGSVRELTGSGTGGSSDGGMPMVSNSDRRLKENIVRIGDHPLGIGVYLFDYRPQFRDALGHERQFGVMADEVERVVPAAVAIASDGYARVNYSAIGVIRH